MTVAVSGDSITFPDNSVQATAPKVGMVNRIINGAMVIDQRNAGASVTPTDTDGRPYALDRWNTRLSQASKFSIQQSSTAPTGFIKSSLITSLSAYSITSSDQFVFIQIVEGLNASDLAWGTASAATVTLSFQVRSSLTGTFGGSLRNAAADRSYPFSYTINAANTWETKTLTIAGDTSGTWLTTNGIGITVGFGFGVGSTLSGTAGAWAGANYASATGAVSVVGTSGATFYITGVQLEKGSTATAFDYLDYGRSLSQCQRYFIKYENSGPNSYIMAAFGVAGATTGGSATITLPVTMRTQPSYSASNLCAADTQNAVTNITSSTIRTDVSTTSLIFIEYNVTSGLTQFRPYYVRSQPSTAANISLSAEL